MPELNSPGSSRLSNTNPGMKEYMLVLVAPYGGTSRQL